MKQLTMMFSLIILFFAIVAVSDAAAKIDYKKLSEQLPMDPAVTTGVLDNGLTYYIRENRKPEQRAELQLVVKCGSVDEEDNQAGLAHFTEHMAFNGTKNFPKNELVSFLESTGMKFGADVNASTGFDRTYYMITIPLDKEGLLEKGFQVLEDWAHNVTFSPEELELERGVIMEEWRVYRGAQSRIMKKHLPNILWGSKFGKRLPIGDTAVIMNAPRERFTALYNDFYRPDLQAIIAIGDFDKNEIEKIIKEKFGSIKMPKNPRKREVHEAPMHDNTIVSIATDKELPMANFSLMFKHKMNKKGTFQSYRDRLVDGLLGQMLSLRLDEFRHLPEPPFMYAGGGNGGFLAGLSAFSLMVVPMGKEYKTAFDITLGEAFRAMAHGFTSTELSRAKKNSMLAIKKAYAERNKTESNRYARECYSHFYQGDGMPGIEYELGLYKQFIPEITLEEINALMKSLVKKESLVITFSAPEKEGQTVPTETEILAWYDAASKNIPEAYVDKVSDSPLFDRDVVPGKIVSEKEIKEVGVTELVFSNGVKVILKPTDFKDDQILMNAFSFGGNSLVKNDDYISASVASSIVNSSGISKFSAVELQKMLTGKVVRVSPYISTLSEGFGRSMTTPDDVETFLQMVNLYFTDPRVDDDAYTSYINKIKESIESSKVDPNSTFRDTINTTMTNYHFRSRPWSEEILKEVNFEKAIKIYKERFADASDFTFIFVGNLDIEKLKPLFAKYLGSLPALNRNEKWVDTKVRYPKGKIDKAVYKGIAEKSSVRLVFSGDFDMSTQNEYDFDAMMDVFSIIVREKIREEKSGTYGEGARGNASEIPNEDYRIDIMFGTDPKRVDELYTELVNLIKKFSSEEVEELYINKVKAEHKRGFETKLKKNSFWLRSLQNSYYYDEAPAKILDYMEYVEKLTAADVLKAAKKYFNFDNSAKFVLYPGKK
ncbi:MAG: insulinase family protein [Chlorobi bacterium]|nr:insulinase family protein [Chlorobiota bacterium]